MKYKVSKPFNIVKNENYTDFRLYLKASNVFVIEAHKEIEYEVAHLQAIINEAIAFTCEKKYLVLIIPAQYSQIGFDGIKLLAQPQAMMYAHAKAYVVKSLSQRIMANFYMKLFKPTVPVGIFNDVRNAEAWLLKKHRHLIL